MRGVKLIEMVRLNGLGNCDFHLAWVIVARQHQWIQAKSNTCIINWYYHPSSEYRILFTFNTTCFALNNTVQIIKCKRFNVRNSCPIK